MEFAILGPLEVRDGARSVALGEGRQRALLALLLLRANETIPRDRLIHELWGESPPRTAAKALQGHISALRGLLEPGRPAGADGRVIVTRAGGYELKLESEQLDLGRFERLRAEGRSMLDRGEPAAAARRLREALALWRGPPLTDFVYEPFAQAEIARLEELRLSTLEDRIEADLAAGRHDDVVGELEALTRENPLRERLRGQLMLALYRGGRQADSLAAYQAGRTALVDELGIEPGRALRDLHQEILRQDPAIDLVSTPAAEADRTRHGTFVGRDGELADLTRGLDGAFAGHGRLFLLVGEPGIGKSRLADELLTLARARGARVLVGRSWEAGGAPAYWPWVQALRSYLPDADAQALRARLGASAMELAQLFPELHDVFPESEAASPVESEGARFRLFEGVRSLLALAGEEQPVVLVLDDLHAADEPSLLLLRYVARGIGDARLLLIGALRDVDPILSGAPAAALGTLVSEKWTTHIALAGLDEGDVAEYIRSSAGIEPGSELVETIHSEAEGNPLFVGEIVRLLASEGRFEDAAEGLGVPPGVRAVIGHRVARLSERCQDILVPASVLGREFDLDVLAQLEGSDRGDLLDVLDEAVLERVLAEVPGSAGRLRFAHALIRDTLYDDLPPVRRMRLHQQVGEAIEAIRSPDLAPHLSELTRHFVEAAPLGVADKAVDYAHRAGDRALGQLAFEEAARLYAIGLTLSEEPVERCDLLLARGEAEARAGETQPSKQTFLEAAELAEVHGLTDHLGRAALGYGGRLIWETSQGDDEWAPLLERALDARGPDDDELHVRLLARLAALREAGYVQDRKAALGKDALEMARRLGDPGALAYALSAYITAVESPANASELLELATELVGVAREAGDNERVFEAHEHRFGRLQMLGDSQKAGQELSAMRRLAAQLNQPGQQWLAGASEVRLALLEGRLQEADELIPETLQLGRHAHAEIAENTHRLQLYLLRREQGRLGEVEDLVRRSVVDYPANQVWRCVLASTTAELGQEVESGRTLQTLAAEDFAVLPFREMWLVSMAFLAEAAHRLDDADSASVLYRLLFPYADLVAISTPEIVSGAVARYLGLLAATCGHAEDAAVHFEHAMKVNERMGARPWLAHSQEDYARLALAGGDRALAERLLAEAIATYRGLGMETHAASASALAG